jgi:hypothetical protein
MVMMAMAMMAMAMAMALVVVTIVPEALRQVGWLRQRVEINRVRIEILN